MRQRTQRRDIESDDSREFGLVTANPAKPSDVVRAAVRGELLHTYGLTPRWIQVLELAAGGYSDPEIARVLHLSTSSVRDHFRYLREALEKRNRAQLIAQWIELMYQVIDGFQLAAPPAGR